MNKNIRQRLKKYGLGGSVGSETPDGQGIGKPFLDMGMQLAPIIENLLSPVQKPSRQPIVSATSARNMVSPYSSFAFGGSVEDMDEDELAQIQQEADEAGMTLEEYMEQIQSTQGEGGEEGSGEDDFDPLEEDYTDAMQGIEMDEDTEPEDQYAMGGIVQRFEKGGVVKKKPIIVNDPNDPRLKAYNDSLLVHNTGQNYAKVIRNNIIKDFSSRAAGGKISPTQLKVGVAQEDKSADPYYKGKYNLLGLKSNGFYKTHVHQDNTTSNGVGGITDDSSWDGDYYSPSYKEPEQPVVYQKKTTNNRIQQIPNKNKEVIQRITSKSKPIDISAKREVSNINNIESSNLGTTKPTKSDYSFTFRNDNGQQQTIYFNNEDEYNNALNNNKTYPYDKNFISSTKEGTKRSSLFNNKPKFGLGGRVGNNIPIEVEDDEVVETPDGQMQQMDGATHEEGGIDIAVPHSTKIFSDRIKIGGKTMAERKLNREKVIDKLNNSLFSNGNSNLSKKTIERTEMGNRQQEAGDMAVQQLAAKLHSGKKQRFAGGGVVLSRNPNRDYWIPNVSDDDVLPDLDAPKMANLGTPQYQLPDINPPQSTTVTLPTFSSPSTSTPTVDNPDFTDDSWGLGDTLGVAGNAFAGIAPLINTMNNKAATKPNINRFRGYGKSALESNTAAQTFIAGMASNAMKDASTNANTQYARNNGTASSINTQRALNTATDLVKNKAVAGISDNISKQMIGVLDRRGQIQQNIDSTVMGAEERRDNADKADIDNFYSNLGQDYQTLGASVANAGRNINKKNQKNVNRNLVNSEATNDIGVNSKGNIVNRHLTQNQIDSLLAKGWTIQNGRMVKPKQ